MARDGTETIVGGDRPSSSDLVAEKLRKINPTASLARWTKGDKYVKVIWRPMPI